jgi:Ca2+ transporting ATPase
LKNLGKVVAVTGDGSNDAPALKKSDVGLAMMSGTALAKESADIILLDDNFKSVSNSVKWGRNIYANIRKFLQFQITVNITALAISVIGSIALQASPLSSVQMLWVNLLMDSFGALALATEPPSEALLKGPPHGREDYVINKDMKFTIITQSIFQLPVLISLLFGCPYMLDIKPTWEDTHYSQENYVHFTIVFNTFVMIQFFNEINCRKLSVKELNVFRGFFNNSLFVIILIATMIVQILIVEFGGRPLRTSPLTLSQHAFCIGIGMLAIPWTFLAKSILKCSRKQQDGPQRRSTSSSVNYSRLS